MNTQASQVVVTGTNAVTAVSGQSVALFSGIGVTNPEGSQVTVSLLVGMAGGTLSIANLPAAVRASLTRSPATMTSIVTLSGTAAQVQAALAAVTLTAAPGVTRALTGSYQLVVANGAVRSFVSGSLTVSPPQVPVARPLLVVATPAVTPVPVLPYVQTGTSYVASATAAQTSTINVGLTASTITSGAGTLDFTGGNSTLFLSGSGAARVQSLGGNTVWVGAAPLTYVSGGSTSFHVGSGSFVITGGAAGDNNTVTLDPAATGSVNITSLGAARTTIYGGMSFLHFTGDNATIMLNGPAMTGSALVDSTGGNAVWAGAGSLTYHNGGASTLVLSSGSAAVSGGDARSSSVIDAGSGSLTYAGSAEAATIRGGTGQALVQAGSGNLRFAGGTGAATVTGGAGSDTVSGGSGGGWFGAGHGGSSVLQAGSGMTFLQGVANGDLLIGGNGDATRMQAGAGNETLVGGNSSGIVTMTLGSGADLVQLATGSSSIAAGSGTATIQGGGGHDGLSILAGSGATTFLAPVREIAAISGFRVGTDHLVLSGTSAASTTLVGASTVIALSGGGSITLGGVDNPNAALLG